MEKFHQTALRNIFGGSQTSGWGTGRGFLAGGEEV